MIHCPLYDVDFKEIDRKKDLYKVGGCTQYVKENRCNARKRGGTFNAGVCVAEEAEDV